jgi:hypothetical protein
LLSDCLHNIYIYIYIYIYIKEDQNLKIMLIYLPESSQHSSKVMIQGRIFLKWGGEWCKSTSIIKGFNRGTNWVYYKVEN